MSEAGYTWLLFVGYLVFAAWSGVRWRSGGRSFASYSIGSRAVSPLWIGASVAAAATSSATFVINPGLVYLYGWSGFVAIFAASSLGFFVGLAFFSKSFRRIGDRVEALTVPQWIGDRFASDRLKVFFALLSLLQVAYLVLIAVGIAVVLTKTLGLSSLAALTLIVGVTSAYILLGGASTHVMTSSGQALVMLVVAALMVGSGASYLLLGPEALFERLREVGPHYASVTNPDSQLYRNLFETLVAQFVVGFVATLLPHLISKSLFLRSERDVNRYLTTAIVAILIFKSVLLAGLFARLRLPGDLLPPDQVMATYVVEVFSPFVRALITLGIVAAGLSTMEGILLSLSSIVSNDLWGTLSRSRGDRGERERRSLVVARVFLLVLVPVTIYLGYRQIVAPSLSVIIFALNGVLGWTAASFVPILIGVYFKRAPIGWLAAASLTGLVVHFGIVLFELLPMHDNPMVPATYAVVASTVVGALGLVVARDRFVRAERLTAAKIESSSPEPAEGRG